MAREAGIQVSSGSTVTGNAVYENLGDGIKYTGEGTLINDNAVHANRGYGLNLGAQVSYRGNMISTAIIFSGTVNGGVNAGGNVCNGNLTCP
jgi:hypothetical protein